MLLSMTGFGKAIVEAPSKKFTVEVKSLNSKQLDLSARIPAAYRDKELDIRSFIASQLERGKVDVSVYVESSASDAVATLNMETLALYKAQIEAMSQKLMLPLPLDWYATLLRMPDVMKTDSMVTPDDAEIKALMTAVKDAVAELMQFRRKEGRKLEDFFAMRLNKIRDLLDQVPQFENERIVKIRARIEEQLGKINKVDYDRARLEQEMIYYIEKLDINEEKQRLAQHIDYFRETMESGRGQGKKLGFIAQEMGREINTLGSKSNHAEMQIIVVKMKDELEQIKEQVLNVM
ncbi:MAG: YicC/YloC family endoribonuclease [Muribaculaceae bacterium]|nr:YicC/YloC family endoribonuclease [Muribaculaceae bacterium]